MVLIGRQLIQSTINYTILSSSFLKMHTKCLGGLYLRSNVKRFEVPDEKVEWTVNFPKYSPVDYTAPQILNKPPYADHLLSDPEFKPDWNKLDGLVNRISYEGAYKIIDGLPKNPIGRTGLIGRGLLGRWGPNHAADPIVSRWKILDSSINVHEESGLPIMQFACIQRQDCGQWAIPGGMVDPGEVIAATLLREFMEETMNSLEMNPEIIKEAKEQVQELFRKGTKLYSGYVDDPRNTDNAWMETVAFNFHDDQLDGVMHKINLEAGDDARAVQWVDISRELNLYASHSHLVQKVAELHGAHW